MILQLRHITFITQSLKEFHSGSETGLIDTGPLNHFPILFNLNKFYNSNNILFMFSNMIAIKHAFAYQKSSFSF